MSCVLHRYARKASQNLDAGCVGRIQQPGVLVHTSLPYLVSSFDGVFKVQSGGVLVRTILHEVKASKYRITPGVYKHQMQLRLLVSQADYGIVLCYKMGDAAIFGPFNEAHVTEVRVDVDARWRTDFLFKSTIFYDTYLKWLFAEPPDEQSGRAVVQILM